MMVIFLLLLFSYSLYASVGFEDVGKIFLKGAVYPYRFSSSYAKGKNVIVWDGREYIYLYDFNRGKYIPIFKKNGRYPSYPSVDFIGDAIVVAYQVYDKTNMKIGYTIYQGEGNKQSFFFPYSSELSALPVIKCLEDKCFLFYHEFASKARKKITLYFSYTEDFLEWSSPKALTQGMELSVRGNFIPRVFKYSNDRFLVIWQSRVERRGKIAGDDIFGRFVTLDGETGPIFRFTKDSLNDSARAIIDNNGFIHLVFLKRTPIWRVFYSAFSLDGDRVYDKALPVSMDKFQAYMPRITFFDNKLFFLWGEKEKAQKGKLFMRIFENGKFSSIGTVSEDNENVSFFDFLDKKGEPIIGYVVGGLLKLKKRDLYVAPPTVKLKKIFEGKGKVPKIIVSWSVAPDPSGIKEFYYSVDKNPDSIPDGTLKLDGEIREYVLPELPEGVYYFHLRAKDGAGNLSDTVHFRFSISFEVPPQPVLVPVDKGYIVSKDRSPIIEWTVKGYRKKIKGFLVYWDKKDFELSEKGFFTKSNSILLKNLSNGIWIFKVAAIDEDNNLGEPKLVRINVVFFDKVPERPIVFKRGNHFKWIVKSFHPIKGYSYGVFSTPFDYPPEEIMTRSNEIIIDPKKYALKEGKKYYFKVAASDIKDNFGPFAIYPFVYTIDREPPFPPRILYVKDLTNIPASVGTLYVFSKDDSGILGYSYLISEKGPVSPPDVIKTRSPFIPIDSLEVGKEYFLSIKAVDYNGNWSKASFFKIRRVKAIAFHKKENEKKPVVPSPSVSKVKESKKVETKVSLKIDFYRLSYIFIPVLLILTLILIFRRFVSFFLAYTLFYMKTGRKRIFQ